MEKQFNFRALFDNYARKDAEQDQWAEYTNPLLISLMRSDKMQVLAQDVFNDMKSKGYIFTSSGALYHDLKDQIGRRMEHAGFLSIRVLEDAFTEVRQYQEISDFLENYFKDKGDDYYG